MLRQYLLEEIKTKYSKAHDKAQKNAALPIEQGGLGLHPNNTPLDRARAMGFDVDTTYYHGTNNTPNFTKFKEGKNGIDELGKGVYFTTHRDIAKTWASGFGNSVPNGRIIPVLLNTGKVYDIHKEKYWPNPNTRKELYQAFKEHPMNSDCSDSEEDQEILQDRRSYMVKHKFNELLKIGGYHSVVDKSSQIPGQINILHPNRIRSIHAAFDPMKKDSEDILA